MLNYTTKTRDIPRDHIPWDSSRGENKCPWDFTTVEVYYEGDKIGQYVRNYPHLLHTFCPFQQNGKDYALISKDYTRTVVIELPSFKFVTSFGNGLHPACYHVPAVNEDVLGVPIGNGEEIWGPSSKWALVAGSYPTDDTHMGYRIQFIDLSRLEEGVVTQDARFGKLEMSGNCIELKEADVPWYSKEDFERGQVWIKVPRLRGFYLPKSPKLQRKFNERLALESEYDFYY